MKLIDALDSKNYENIWILAELSREEKVARVKDLYEDYARKDMHI